MKNKIYLTFILGILLIGIVSAGTNLTQCKKIIDNKEAVEEYTKIVKSPIMEDKIITKSILKLPEFMSAKMNYAKEKKLNPETMVPVPNVKNYQVITTSTIQVQKTETKTKYRFKAKFPFVESYEVKTPLFNIKEETNTRIKAGYKLDEDTGQFYIMEKC